MTRHLFFVLAIFLISCASSVGDSSKFIYSVSKGDKFVLKKNITIGPRDAHVIFQDGKIEKFANIDRYAPFCRFNVNTVGAQTIKPDTFTVTRVAQDEPEVLPYVYNYYVEFRLSAKNNPDVRSLACGAWGSGGETYITYPQMQQALGSYFEIPNP